jgi:oligopeptide transport system substrate-binding protein
MNKYCIFSLTATIFLLANTSCKNEQRNTIVSEGNKNGILHFGNQSEPEDLDPHIVTGVPEFHILQSLFEGLLLRSTGSSSAAGVAHSWDISEDNLCLYLPFAP